jgi:hypothetical protein
MVLVSVTTGIAYDCPKSVASIYKNSLSQKVSLILQEAYKDMGCETHFVARPGKRALAEFNGGQFDGEVFRLKMAERAYKIDFVRSSRPLFTFNGSLWRNPQITRLKNRALGYSRGVLWQENYFKDSMNGVAFNSYEKMFTAYENGSIIGFIAADSMVYDALGEGHLSAQPVNVKTLFSAPVYHYLRKDFTPFMQALSTRIATQALFKAFQK